MTANEKRREFFFVDGERLLWVADQPDPQVPPVFFTIHRPATSDQSARDVGAICMLGVVDFATDPATISVVGPADTGLLKNAYEALANLRDELRRKAMRGFAGLTPQQRRELGRKGGLAAHAHGRAHIFDSESGSYAARLAQEMGVSYRWTAEQAREAGRKGGLTPRRRRKPATNK